MDLDTTGERSLLSSLEFEELMTCRKHIWQRSISVNEEFSHDDQSNIIFQLLDLNQCVALSFESHTAENFYDSANWIRLYGVRHDGASVCVHVYGFSPYFFVTAPEYFSPQNCEDLARDLNRIYSSKFNSNSFVVKSIVSVDFKADMKSVNVRQSQVLKITIYDERCIFKISDLIKEEAEKLIPGFEIQMFEEKVGLLIRFLADNKLHGCSWIKIPSGKFLHLLEEEKRTTCQIEVLMYYKDIECFDYKLDNQFQLSRLRLLSFDIESLSRENRFCNAKHDPVISIANIIRDGVDKERKSFNVVFALGTSKKVKNAQLICFRSEKELLKSWYMFMRLVDPDIFVGHNIINFDLKYLHERACELKIDEFCNLGRNIMFSEFDKLFKQYNITGRLVFDTYRIAKKEYNRLKSYSLQSITKQFFNESKLDVDISMIESLFNGNDEDRNLLNSYCLQDAQLSLKIFDRLNVFRKYVELVKISRIPLTYLLTEDKFNTNLCVIPLIQSAHESMNVLKRTDSFRSKMKLNLCNFSSLYHKIFSNSFLFASIIIEYNLCYSTLIQDCNVNCILKTMYDQSPCGSYIYKKTHLLGIIPRTLLKLSAQLRNVRKKLSRQKQVVENTRYLYCRISAIKSVINTFPGMLLSVSSPYSYYDVRKNVYVYFSTLTEIEQMDLVKKYFG